MTEMEKLPDLNELAREITDIDRRVMEAYRAKEKAQDFYDGIMTERNLARQKFKEAATRLGVTVCY